MQLPRGMIFDMDGTLTVPMLDFPKIKAEMGIGSRPILEALAEMNESEMAAAVAILHKHEDHAAEHSQLNPGCHELLEWIHAQQIKTALVTRNSRCSVNTVMQKHRLPLDILITREDGPHKPHPAPLRLACQRMGLDSDDCWMIGDGQYDIEAGLAAGCTTVWISHGKSKPFAAEPTHECTDLLTLLALLRSAHA